MDININSCLTGAKIADGITVVIDVFRASNTIITCIAKGATYILPIENLNDAYKLKNTYPDHLLFGERGGLPPKGFDYGNSPAKADKLDLHNKKIILTTSAGSQGIVYSKKADEILIGSFANAQAIVDYLKKKNPLTVTLLAIGYEAKEPATEDEACALYIKSKIEGKEVNIDQLMEDISKSDGMSRLKRLGQTDDLDYCLQIDKYHIIPKFYRKTRQIKELDRF